MSSKYYLSCWTEDDGIHSCGHEHESVKDALKVLRSGRQELHPGM